LHIYNTGTATTIAAAIKAKLPAAGPDDFHHGDALDGIDRTLHGEQISVFRR